MSEGTSSSDLDSLRIDPEARRLKLSRARRSVLALLVALVLVLGVAFAWRAGLGDFAASRGRVVRAVRVEAPVTPAGRQLSGTGFVVTANPYVSIGARVPGRIDRYQVEEGQRVTKGEALVSLDQRDYLANVERAEAALEVAVANQSLASSELRRGILLLDNNVAAESDVDVLRNRAAVARAKVREREAELSQVRVNLDYTIIRAPMDAIVLAKLKSEGEMAVPGGFAGSGDLIRLANVERLRAEVDITESELSQISIGARAEVTPDAYPNARYEARVVKLYPQINRQKGTRKVQVEILNPDERLIPDMSARVTFFSDERETTLAPLTIPARALRHAEDGTYVWTARGGSAARVRVVAGEQVGDRIAIADGLSGGEILVVDYEPRGEGEKVQVALE